MPDVEVNDDVTSVPRHHSSFLHRDKEMEHLIGLFGDARQPTVPSLFIYGQKSCGKSAVVSHVLNTRKFAHATINCVECYAQSLVYENVLRSIANKYRLSSSSTARCDNGNDFVRLFRARLREAKCSETFYLVLDKAEYLREVDDFLLPLLVNLRQLSGCNVCVIMITELPWDKFHAELPMKRPHMLFFSDYTNSQLIDLLCVTRSDGMADEYDEKFYRSYLHILVNVFSLTCRDLRELQYLAHAHFSTYCRPIEDGRVGSRDDTRKLWKLIEPSLKQALQDLYFRSRYVSNQPATAATTETQASAQDASDEATTTKTAASSCEKKNSLLVELPFYTKFLLIAAYIASFNPPSTDKRFFIKNSGRMKKRVRHANVTKGKTNCHLQGPHSFALNRMMAIFYSIIDGRTRPTVNLFSQVTNLVSLQLIARISREEEINQPKYKCLVSVDAVTAISK